MKNPKHSQHDRRRSFRSVRIAVLFVFLVALLTACRRDEQEPVIVYVTPTPQASTPAAVVPSAEALEQAAGPDVEFGPLVGAAPTTPEAPVASSPTPRPTNPPGVTFGAVGASSPTPTVAAAAPETTAAPAATTGPSATIPPGVIFGAVVDPNYTLPPSATLPPVNIPPTAIPTDGPSPTPYPGLDPSRVGVQIHANISADEFARVLGHAHALNVGWIKLQFNWSLLEYAPNQYTDLFYGMRRYVQQAHNEGFKVMVSVAKAPGWSRTPDGEGVMHENGPPDDPQMLANFMGNMLTMIGNDGDGTSYISAVEVWNEPNLEREWYGHPLTGDSYMRYFRPAYSAIRQYSPAITIITAGPAPTGDSEWSTNDRNWLQQLYNAGLAEFGGDVQVGIHPYGWANDPATRCCLSTRGWDEYPQFYFLDTIEDYRTIMVNNGHTAAQLWNTEFGWPTFDGLIPASGGTPPPPPTDEMYFSHINQQQQADFTIRAFALGQERDYLGPMMLWNLNFSTVPSAIENGDKKTGYSLLTGQWQPRPVYYAIQQALASR